MSKFRGVKTNNAKTSAKESIRNNMLRLIDNPCVLEVFCGSGEMFKKVWRNADDYTGIDIVKQFDDRHTICGDALKAVTSIDLSKYNIFDIDAYGSPYSILNTISLRIQPGKDYIFVLTDGTQMDLKLGRVCKGIRDITGINFHIVKRANKIHDDIIADVIREIEKRLGGAASDFIIAKGKTGAAMKYYAFKISAS